MRQIKIYDSLFLMSGVGEEWLVKCNVLICKFLDGQLVE